jgi:phenylalanyl-tRNA synthetase beta subunit
VLARGLAYDRDEISDLVEKGGRISRELDHRLDLGAEAIEVPQLAGRRGALCHHPGGASAVVGTLGVLHPRVLANFELAFTASVVELNLEALV